ncbi:MAG: restriction endonuclease [Firmicutes bacterium]|nr:restriction endonuclease [Bacillota bacterium]
MLLELNSNLAGKYTSGSQTARVITENWVAENIFCPRCGNLHVSHFENNRPVADFYCPECGSQYELKSKNGELLNKITDGAYSTMIDRITNFDNPDFFFMSYSKSDWLVRNFFFVPKHFFTPSIIEKRKPLSPNAKRAGWVGCNILLSAIPSTGRIPIIENGRIFDKSEIMNKIAAADCLIVKDINARGWLFDVLFCVDTIGKTDFTLAEMYKFEGKLAEKHPANRNIKPKIRQQLQFLRDKGIIEFVGKGKYRKVI